MANILDRHDPAKAIPQLEKMLKALSKEQVNITNKIENIEIGGGGAGEQLYRVDIYATRGNLLKSIVASTDLEARLYSWDKDITASADESWFNWTRITGDDEDDAEWNTSHGNGKKILTVMEQDVPEQATFVCTVNNGDNIFTESQIVVSSNYELQQVIEDMTNVAEEVAKDIVGGYVSEEDLRKYDEQIQSTLYKANEGYAFEFETFRRTLEELNGEALLQKSYIRLIEGSIYIGNSESLITTVYTGNGLEIRYGDEAVATYTSEALTVKSVYVENQIAYSGEWATRLGAYIEGVGHNLNDIWIGG